MEDALSRRHTNPAHLTHPQTDKFTCFTIRRVGREGRANRIFFNDGMIEAIEWKLSELSSFTINPFVKASMHTRQSSQRILKKKNKKVGILVEIRRFLKCFNKDHHKFISEAYIHKRSKRHVRYVSVNILQIQ